jgi:molybdopterin-biosynthesis enzyme MoeA-like protein
MEETMVASSDKLSGLLPTADEMMERLALAEADKADEARRKQAEAEAEKKMLFDKLTKPSGVSDEEALRRVAKIVERAVSSGLTEVQVYRFPNNLCTDHGRAINQREPGWEKTLTGLPKEMYEFWERQLRPRGYKIGFLIVDWPGGSPGDVGIILKWS